MTTYSSAVSGVKANAVSWALSNSDQPDYNKKIHRYWDELHRLRPTPRCVCAKRTYNFNKKLDELETDARLVQFLMGLSQNFEVIRSQILSLDPLPSVSKAFSLVVNVETEKEINSS
ncbi:uncharacterized protein G2W53_025870 [Senna tora]|uniref:Retrotransposon gag domain-containing protein n=1 Tax=Senna tora TaxID=362788 RepID=A0A834WEK8_9FABA|nr:uncharacterized protein G2W53_025870 [Senna tora]